MYNKIPELHGKQMHAVFVLKHCSCVIGVKATTMNMHLLSHVTEGFKNYSYFPFESMNRELKLMFHGSQDMTKQVYIRLYVIVINLI